MCLARVSQLGRSYDVLTYLVAMVMLVMIAGKETQELPQKLNGWCMYDLGGLRLCPIGSSAVDWRRITEVRLSLLMSSDEALQHVHTVF